MDHAGLITYSLDVLRLGTTALTSHGLGAGDVLIGGAFEVDGISYFDSEVRLANTKGLNTNLTNDDYYTLGAVDNDTSTITEVARITGAAQPSFDLKLARFGTAVLTADAAHRGMLYFVAGGTGVADKLYIVMKGTDNLYSAVQVAIG